jgi:hypothetical protein
MKNFRLIRGLSTTCVLTLYILSRALPAPAITNTAVQYDPVADPRAVVIVGAARFTIMTPQLIRMEWASDRNSRIREKRFRFEFRSTQGSSRGLQQRHRYRHGTHCGYQRNQATTLTRKTFRRAE